MSEMKNYGYINIRGEKLKKLYFPKLATDEFLIKRECDEWERVINNTREFEAALDYRRKIDIGEGYRLVKVDEIIEEDEFFEVSSKSWLKAGCKKMTPIEVNSLYQSSITYRRKISENKQIMKNIGIVIDMHADKHIWNLLRNAINEYLPSYEYSMSLLSFSSPSHYAFIDISNYRNKFGVFLHPDDIEKARAECEKFEGKPLFLDSYTQMGWILNWIKNRANEIGLSKIKSKDIVAGSTFKGENGNLYRIVQITDRDIYYLSGLKGAFHLLYNETALNKEQVVDFLTKERACLTSV